MQPHEVQQLVQNEYAQKVHEQICRHVPDVLAYSDFFVLDRKLALSIQPAVPVSSREQRPGRRGVFLAPISAKTLESLCVSHLLG